MKKKILLLGSAGMAGHLIKSYLQFRDNNLEIIDLARSSKFLIPSIEMDVSRFDALEEIIEISSFQYIINCVGLLSEKSNNNPDQAILVNSYLPRFLESLTAKTKTKIIHISTDCVFSGKKGDYLENDIKDGIDVYAKTKSLGEIINNKDLTIRTSIIGPELNPKGVGLFNWFINSKGTIKGYNNAYWSGVTTLELAKFIYKVIDKNNISGLIHLTNNIKISKYDILQILKSSYKKNDVIISKFSDYKVDKSIINTRKNLDFKIPSYEIMFNQMKNWTENTFRLKF